MYALNIAENNRILSACVVLPTTPASMPRVDALPEGDINNWMFVDNQYVYDPLPKPDTDLRASANYEAGTVFTEDGNLYLATESISTHERIIPGSNCEPISLADALNALNKEE